MIDDVKYLSNTQVSVNETGVKGNNSKVSFKGNPNAVDNTPTTDTYQPQSVPQAPASDGMLKKVAYIIPTWFALNEGTKLFDRACGGEYEKSLVGRLGSFGDRVSDSRLVKNSFVDKLKTHGSTIKRNIQAFIDRHPMLSAMQKTPTKPENSMPKSFMESQAEADLKEASSKFREFFDKSPKSLKDAGASKAEIEALKSKFGTDMFGRIKNSKAAIQEFQLTKLGGTGVLDTIARREAALGRQLQRFEQVFAALPDTDPRKALAAKRIQDITALKEGYKATTLNNLKLKAAGLTKTSFEAIQKDPVKNAGILERALANVKAHCPKLSQSLNKIKSINTPKSKLGRLFPKMAKLGMRGLTFGGGTFNTLFIAFMMANSVKNAVEAPEGKKTGTIAHGLLENMSWIISMPIALGAMHSVNGIKNTGYSKAQIKNYMKNLKAFNENVKLGKLTDKAAYDSALSALKASKGAIAGKQNWFTKGMKGIARFLSIGLEQPASFKEATQGLKGSAKWAARFRNMGHAMPNFLRNCVGYPLRFGIYMFAFAPLVDKLFSGVTSAIFGKAWDPEAEKEKQAEEAARRAALYPGPRILPNPQAEIGVGTTDLNTVSDKNLIKQKIMGVKPQQGSTPVTTTVITPNGMTTTTTGTEPINNNQPFIPPVQQNGTNQSDPNKSEYDTVPRTYVPQIDFNNPFPFSDPMANPNAAKNYQTAQEIAMKSDKLADDIEAFLGGK